MDPDNLSSWQNVYAKSYHKKTELTKCLPDKMSHKIRADKMSSWQNVYQKSMTKCHPDNMSSWQNVCRPDWIGLIILYRCHTKSNAKKINLNVKRCVMMTQDGSWFQFFENFGVEVEENEKYKMFDLIFHFQKGCTIPEPTAQMCWLNFASFRIFKIKWQL